MATLKIGCHLSASGGYLAMGKTANRIGADTFAFFTRNPRGGSAKPQNPADVAAFLAYAKEHGIDRLVAHAPYTLNACSANPKTREFAEMAMRDDLMRLENLPGNYYNFHPGCHVGQGTEIGISQIAALLNKILRPNMQTAVLLETMAGKGTEVGGTFEELAAIISQVECKEKLGVCLDTCHIWDAGYDIQNHLDGVLTEFDRTVGLSKLKAIHLNDSLNVCGAKKDRHALIGQGKIGLDAIARIINHDALYTLPFILETPTDDDGHGKEIAMLRTLYTR